MSTEDNGSRKDSLSPYCGQKPKQIEQASTESCFSFPYDPFRDPTKQIRLCRLLPGSGSSPLTARLETCTLEKAIGTFSALSYAWGTLPSIEPILLNGVLVHGSAEAVTQNLYTYLFRLRAIRFEGWLWVDALCINQHDKDEKAAQVALMSSLFHGAKDVIILLDEECRNISRANVEHHLIRRTIEQLARGEHFYQLSCCSEGSVVDCQLEEFTRVACRFLDSTWFSRVWTVQETILSRRSYILFANELFPWERFEEASKQWHLHLKASCCAHIVEHLNVSFIEALHRIYTHISAIKHIRARLPEKPSILEAILCFQHLSAKLPRDKLNGFRGLHRADSELPLPDYKKPEAEVYEEVTVWFLENARNLVALALDLSDGSTGLPSWVVNISLPPKLNTNYWRGQVELYLAYACRFRSGPTDRGFRYQAPGELRIDAIEIDVISEVSGGMFVENMEPEDYVKLLKKWYAFVSGQQTSKVKCDSFSSEFCATALGGFVKTQGPGLRRADESDYAQWRHAVLEIERHPSTESMHGLPMRSHLTAVMRRMLFKTKSGSIGLGLPSMRLGDRIWLFKDATAPFVTRQVPDAKRRESLHELLGYCYHQKLMEEHFDITCMLDRITTCVLAGRAQARLHQSTS